MQQHIATLTFTGPIDSWPQDSRATDYSTYGNLANWLMNGWRVIHANSVPPNASNYQWTAYFVLAKDS